MKKDKLLVLPFAMTAALACHGAFAADAADVQAANTWKYTVGLGVVDGPAYPGATETKFKAFPLVSATYGRFFAGAADVGVSLPAGVGYNLIQTGKLTAGAALGYDLYSVRKESDDASRLRGMGDINRAGHAALYAKYGEKSLSAYGALIASSGGQGFQVKAGVKSSLQISPQLIFSSGPSVTWGSEKANQTYYGVSAAQSAASGKSQYTAPSGFSDVSFSAGLVYLYSPKITIGTNVSASYLPDTVTDSPIIDKTITTSVSVFTSYKF